MRHLVLSACACLGAYAAGIGSGHCAAPPPVAMEVDGAARHSTHAAADAALLLVQAAPPSAPASKSPPYRIPGGGIKADLVARGEDQFKKHNYRDAAMLFREAADAGNSQGQNWLGALYQGGLGVPRDISEAVRLYIKAAKAGNRSAMSNLGSVYEGNWGIPQDLGEARKWFTLAARLGDAHAKSELEQFAILSAPRKAAAASALPPPPPPSGAVSAAEALSRYRVARARNDYAGEFQWARIAAEAGQPEGKYVLAALYEHGIGVAKDSGKSLDLYRQAAEAGWYEAEYALAFKSFVGFGMPRDQSAARAWGAKAFQQALPLAQNGDPHAQWLVGRMYGDGLGGVRDPVEGQKWLAKAVAQFRTAAEQGDAQLAAIMEFAYRAGWGVQKDEEQANAWLKKEVEAGYPPALERKY